MKKLRQKIDVTIEKTDTGYSAYADDLNVYTTAETASALYQQLVEALNLHFEEEGYTVDATNLRTHLDLQQFFQYYKVLNAKFLAEQIGMNPTLLSQYVRGIKRPSSKQTEKIIRGIRNIGKELSDLHLQTSDFESANRR